MDMANLAFLVFEGLVADMATVETRAIVIVWAIVIVLGYCVGWSFL